MNVVITGGAGFMGSRLARDLLAAGSLDVAGDGARPLARVTLIDGRRLTAEFSGPRRDPRRQTFLREIKAVSHHALELDLTPGRCRWRRAITCGWK